VWFAEKGDVVTNSKTAYLSAAPIRELSFSTDLHLHISSQVLVWAAMLETIAEDELDQSGSLKSLRLLWLQSLAARHSI
jgi:hypothetical protein